MTPSSLTIQTLWRGKMPGVLEFGGLINQIPSPSVIFDRQRNLAILGNSAALKLTAYTQEEMTGFSADDLLHDSNIYSIMPGEERKVDLHRRNRPPVAMTAQGSYIDNENQWLLVSLTPLQAAYPINKTWDEGTLSGLMAMASIGEKQDIRDALHTALEISGRLLETRQICLYQADDQNTYLKKTISLEENNDFPDSLPFDDLSRLATPLVWTQGKRVLSDIHRAGRMENYVYIVTVPLGQPGALFGLLATGAKDLVIDEQQVRLLEVIGAHITAAFMRFNTIDRLKDELVQRDQVMAIYNDQFEQAKEGILVMESDGQITQVNPSAEEMLGYGGPEIVGQPIENILIGPANLSLLVEQAAHGISTPDMGIVSVHKRNGQSFPAQIKIMPVMRHNQTQAIMVYVTDVSDFEQIRIRTQQLEHRAILGEMMAVFAHEVRNPINNIFTGIQLLSSRFPDDEQIQELINRMTQDYYRLNHLMESVLNYARASGNKMEELDPEVLLQKILDRWRPKLAKAKVEAKYFKASENIPHIWGDPRTLEQVFTNLISNAVDAMSNSGGTLTVRLALVEQFAGKPHVEIDISDNGPGIPDNMRVHIFEPFVSNKSTGTGLGLAIVKNIITSHKGTIEVKSFPGGTLFQVYLPAYTGE